MAAVLPAFSPKQGILLNPSPTGSPYIPPTSLPATPNLVSSYSSLPSSSSSHPNSDADNYFVPASGTSSPPLMQAQPHRSSGPTTTAHSGFEPSNQRHAHPPAVARRIRFAPLPDPRREVLVTESGQEVPISSIFLDETEENVVTVPIHDSKHYTTDSSNPNGVNGATPNSLLFTCTPNGISLVNSLESSSTTSPNPNVQSPHLNAANASPGPSHILLPASPALSPCIQPAHDSIEQDSLSRDWHLLTPTSPNIPLSAVSSTADLSIAASDRESLRGVPHSGHHHHEGKSKWSKKIFRPLFGKRPTRSSGEDGAHGMWRVESGESSISRMSAGYESDDRLARVRSGGSTFSLGKDKKSKRSRSQSGSKSTTDFGAPLDRVTSTNTAISTTSTVSAPAMPAPLHRRPLPGAKTHALFSSPTATSLNIFGSNKSTPSHSRNNSGNGVPLGRSQSLNTDVRGLKSHPAPVGGVRRGQLRMLNGRVYGARRLDPFANAVYDEPEFVEWGYGGMGSVNNTNSSGAWSKLQSGGVNIGAEEGSTSGGSVSGGSGRGADEDDDGSGMAWVKKRREAREREKKEKEREEKEKAEAEEIARFEREERDLQEKGLLRGEEVTETHTGDEPHSSVSDPDPPHLAVDSGDNADQVTLQEEHVTTAINIPAPQHRHHNSHRRKSSSVDRTIRGVPERRSSADTAKGIPASLKFTSSSTVTPTGKPEDEVEIFSSSVPEVEGEAAEDTSSPQASSTSSSSVSEGAVTPKVTKIAEGQESSASSIADYPMMSPDVSANATEDEDEDEADDEEYNTDEEPESLTALSAGVEKISRHKDKTPSIGHLSMDSKSHGSETS
ncbi:hypothetical protein ABKN59_003026 [Abortiporus biennis]